ncbi:hypothetical protein M885DRAFT_577084, partial [Pelagophyceae sp. CCMP2097]
MAIGRSKFVPTDVDGNPITGKGSDSQYRRRTETMRERLSSFTEEEEEEGLLLTIEAKLFRMEKKLDILAAGGRSSLPKVKPEAAKMKHKSLVPVRTDTLKGLKANGKLASMPGFAYPLDGKGAGDVAALRAIQTSFNQDESNTTLEEEADLCEAEETNRRETELNRAHKCHIAAEKELAAAEAEHCETVAEQNRLGQSAKLALSSDSSVFRDYLNATARVSLLKDNVRRLVKKTQKAGAGLFVLEAEDEGALAIEDGEALEKISALKDGDVDGAPA